MHLVTEHADMHHFADDTSLLYGHKSVKKINQIKNFEIKRFYIDSGQCFLNSSKIEIITFKSNKKKITQNLDFIFKRE